MPTPTDQKQNTGAANGHTQRASAAGNHSHMPASQFDLARAASDEMHAAGFHPEFGPDVKDQVNAIRARLEGSPRDGEDGVEDLRSLTWSSIDNDTSRDLDQIEVAERTSGGIRLRVAIGDVANAVDKDSPIDRHALAQTQTIYTAVKNFPMLPLELSTDMTSLNENGERLAVVMSFTVAPDGTMSEETVSRAWVRNRAQLAYSRVGPFLQAKADGAEQATDTTQHIEALRSDSARTDHAGDGMGGEDAGSLFAAELAEQLRLQDEGAQALHRARVQNGALEFHRAEAEPVLADGKLVSVHAVLQNRAMYVIEDLMVAANGVMARTLRAGGRSGLQRVVRVPKRWDRMVAIAAEHGCELPAAPDSQALNEFLAEQRRSDPAHYPDLAVAMIKLMGPGEYTLMRPEDDPTGHFGLAARDYTHSTAPNRRFPDMVTQRILHAMMSGAEPPYSDDELEQIATHCNEADTALRKIERRMQKRVAAVAMAQHIGQDFGGVITGVSDKGVYARVIDPPFEGRVIQGFEGLDVGDCVKIKLLHTDPQRAFIDFALVSRMRRPCGAKPGSGS